MNNNINNNTEKKKNVNPNIKTEAYKINLDVENERVLYERLLKKSNNRSGLVKDALTMYLALIERGAYVSPFMKNNDSDWNTILNNLSLDNNLGRPAQVVKEEIIEQKIQQQEQQPVQQPRKEELNTASVCEDDFNMDDDDDLEWN